MADTNTTIPGDASAVDPTPLLAQMRDAANGQECFDVSSHGFDADACADAAYAVVEPLLRELLSVAVDAAAARPDPWYESVAARAKDALAIGS